MSLTQAVRESCVGGSAAVLFTLCVLVLFVSGTLQCVAQGGNASFCGRHVEVLQGQLSHLLQLF